VATEVETLINALKQEPAELEDSGVKNSRLWNLATLFVRICLWPIRALSMLCIVPTSWINVLSQEQQNGILEYIEDDYHTINYSTPSNSECSMLLAPMKNETQVRNRKLVILFGGNAQPAISTVACFVQTIAQTILYFVKTQDKSKQINNDLLVVEYPKMATTSQQLVDAGVSAVIRAINAGYQPENITIAGHSLGGAVSAVVLKEISEKYKHVMQDQKFAGYVNHKSFTNLGDFIAAHAHHKDENTFKDQSYNFINDTKSSWLGKFFNGLTSLLGLQLDAESALLSPDSLLVKQMKFYADDHDEVIRHGASMTARMEPKSSNTIRIKYTAFNEHSLKGSNSLYKPSKVYTAWNKNKTIKIKNTIDDFFMNNGKWRKSKYMKIFDNGTAMTTAQKIACISKPRTR
jgi:hypothetical protein